MSYILSCAYLVVTAVCLERSDFDNNDLIQLLSIVIILGVGAFVREVLGRLPLKIPYTVAIFFVGLGVGRLSDEICPILDDFVAIVQLKPQLILSTFLPVLIFESAMEINIHTFRRTLPQVYYSFRHVSTIFFYENNCRFYSLLDLDYYFLPLSLQS